MDDQQDETAAPGSFDAGLAESETVVRHGGRRSWLLSTAASLRADAVPAVWGVFGTAIWIAALRFLLPEGFLDGQTAIERITCLTVAALPPTWMFAILVARRRNVVVDVFGQRLASLDRMVGEMGSRSRQHEESLAEVGRRLEAMVGRLSAASVMAESATAAASEAELGLERRTAALRDVLDQLRAATQAASAGSMTARTEAEAALKQAQALMQEIVEGAKTARKVAEELNAGRREIADASADLTMVREAAETGLQMVGVMATRGLEAAAAIHSAVEGQTANLDLARDALAGQVSRTAEAMRAHGATLTTGARRVTQAAIEIQEASTAGGRLVEAAGASLRDRARELAGDLTGAAHGLQATADAVVEVRRSAAVDAQRFTEATAEMLRTMREMAEAAAGGDDSALGVASNAVAQFQRVVDTASTRLMEAAASVRLEAEAMAQAVDASTSRADAGAARMAVVAETSGDRASSVAAIVGRFRESMETLGGTAESLRQVLQGVEGQLGASRDGMQAALRDANAVGTATRTIGEDTTRVLQSLEEALTRVRGIEGEAGQRIGSRLGEMRRASQEVLEFVGARLAETEPLFARLSGQIEASRGEMANSREEAGVVVETVRAQVADLQAELRAMVSGVQDAGIDAVRHATAALAPEVPVGATDEARWPMDIESIRARGANLARAVLQSGAELREASMRGVFAADPALRAMAGEFAAEFSRFAMANRGNPTARDANATPLDDGLPSLDYLYDEVRKARLAQAA